MPVSWFREWFNSPYYYQLYADHNEEEAADFIEKLLQFLQPPSGSRMLDIACGRGRHAKLLANRGFDVTGYDISPDAIRYAMPFAGDHLQFYEHDMRFIFRTNYFDFAFNFYTSFGYFQTCREDEDAVRSISQSLKPNGILVMDFLNMHYAIEQMVPNSEKVIEGVHYNITKWVDNQFLYKRIRIEDENTLTCSEFTERIARFYLSDFESMFTRHKLKIEYVFGDYQLGSFDVKNSPRLLMIAQKVE